MKKNTLKSLLFSAVGVVFPSLVQAVVVPTELLQTEMVDTKGTLYGLVLVVFFAGIAFGVWVQKKLKQPIR